MKCGFPISLRFFRSILNAPSAPVAMSSQSAPMSTSLGIAFGAPWKTTSSVVKQSDYEVENHVKRGETWFTMFMMMFIICHHVSSKTRTHAPCPSIKGVIVIPGEMQMYLFCEFCAKVKHRETSMELKVGWWFWWVDIMMIISHDLMVIVIIVIMNVFYRWPRWELHVPLQIMLTVNSVLSPSPKES